MLVESEAYSFALDHFKLGDGLVSLGVPDTTGILRDSADHCLLLYVTISYVHILC